MTVVGDRRRAAADPVEHRGRIRRDEADCGPDRRRDGHVGRPRADHHADHLLPDEATRARHLSSLDVFPDWSIALQPLARLGLDLVTISAGGGRARRNGRAAAILRACKAKNRAQGGIRDACGAQPTRGFLTYSRTAEPYPKSRLGDTTHRASEVGLNFVPQERRWQVVGANAKRLAVGWPRDRSAPPRCAIRLRTAACYRAVADGSATPLLARRVWRRKDIDVLRRH